MDLKNLLKKHRLIFNIASNFFSIAVNLLIGVFMAPYLIKKLGIEIYGIIALVNTFPPYIQIFTNGLSNSTTKYMSISLEKGDNDDANAYFNTSINILFKFIIGLFPLVLLLSIYTPVIFNVPVNGESESKLLVFLVLLATFVNILQAPISSVYQICHRFLQKNIILVSSKLTAFALLLFLFQNYAPEAWFVGLYQLAITIISVLLLSSYYRKFQNIFSFKKSLYKFEIFKEIRGLGFWNSVNDIAVLFFLMINQVLINKYLGVLESGLFGPVLILISLTTLGSGAISNVIMPFIYRDIAVNKNQQLLESKLFLISKVLVYFMGLPVMIMIVFTNEILLLWLGSDFVVISFVLRCFLISLFFGGILFLPYSHFFRGRDKIKIPSIVNLIFGIFNIVLILIFFKLNLGLSSVAYSFVFTFGLRGVFFNTIYLSIVGNNTFFNNFKRIFRLVFFLMTTFYLLYLLNLSDLNFYFKIVMTSLLYIGIIFLVGLNKNDKESLLLLINK